MTNNPQQTRLVSRFILHWLPVVVMAGVIFLLSAQPDLRSPLPSLYDFIARKIAHLTEYGLFAFLLIRALRHAHRLPVKDAAVIALVVAVLYAISDEFHQSFIHGRHMAVTDVLIDTAGAFIGATIASWPRFFLKLKRP